MILLGLVKNRCLLPYARDCFCIQLLIELARQHLFAAAAAQRGLVHLLLQLRKTSSSKKLLQTKLENIPFAFYVLCNITTWHREDYFFLVSSFLFRSQIVYPILMLNPCKNKLLSSTYLQFLSRCVDQNADRHMISYNPFF